jgi:antitoxin ChpS
LEAGVHTTKLRKVGGSVMVAIPPAFLDQLSLTANASVGLAITGGRLVVEPITSRPRYTFADLKAQCDLNAPEPTPDPEWTSGEATGGELI